MPALISRRPYPFSPQWVSLSVGELLTRGYFSRYVGSGATGVLETFGGRQKSPREDMGLVQGRLNIVEGSAMPRPVVS